LPRESETSGNHESRAMKPLILACALCLAVPATTLADHTDDAIDALTEAIELYRTNQAAIEEKWPEFNKVPDVRARPIRQTSESQLPVDGTFPHALKAIQRDVEKPDAPKTVEQRHYSSQKTEQMFDDIAETLAEASRLLGEGDPLPDDWPSMDDDKRYADHIAYVRQRLRSLGAK